MTEPDAETGLPRERVLVIVLALASVVVAYLLWRLVEPFVAPLAWALVLAVVAHPMHEAIRKRVRWPSIAAGLAVVAVTVIIAIPTTFVVRQAGTEAIESVATVRNFLAGERWDLLVERFPRAADMRAWLEREVDLEMAVERAGTQVARGVRSTLEQVVATAFAVIVTLYLLFFFLRDEASILRRLRRTLPLERTEAERMRSRVRDTITAIVFGRVVVAALQGALGGLMFWWLGLPSPILWGVIMGLLAMLPVLGPPIVWGPAFAFFALSGEWGKALALLAFGAVVIGSVDNLLYPVLVKGRMQIHTVPAFISVLGGVFAFGATGIVLGPVILAVALALIDIWQRRMALGETG